jgi:hypothetical protein
VFFIRCILAVTFMNVKGIWLKANTRLINFLLSKKKKKKKDLNEMIQHFAELGLEDEAYNLHMS